MSKQLFKPLSSQGSRYYHRDVLDFLAVHSSIRVIHVCGCKGANNPMSNEMLNEFRVLNVLFPSALQAAHSHWLKDLIVLMVGCVDVLVVGHLNISMWNTYMTYEWNEMKTFPVFNFLFQSALQAAHSLNDWMIWVCFIFEYYIYIYMYNICLYKCAICSCSCKKTQKTMPAWWEATSPLFLHTASSLWHCHCL